MYMKEKTIMYMKEMVQKEKEKSQVLQEGDGEGSEGEGEDYYVHEG